MAKGKSPKKEKKKPKQKKDTAPKGTFQNSYSKGY